MFKHTDPFSYKSFSRLHPVRVAFTVWARWHEWQARRNYESYAMELKMMEGYEHVNVEFDQDQTAVTTIQMQQLLAALKRSENKPGTCVIEIGAFRGETSACLAAATAKQVVCVDPYIGYGGAENDYAIFKENTAGYGNITHLKMTSGKARKQWEKNRQASLIFIDAVHDYINTGYDIYAWKSVLCAGGFLALHDVDQKQFAGTRRAAYACLDEMQLAAHVDNLAIFEKK